jgi:hypothetical protein
MLKTIFRTFLLGLGVGVLVAPRPGRETRQMLSERFNRLFGGETNTSALEWDRPLSDDVNASVTPSQHYNTAAVPASAFERATAAGNGDADVTGSDVAGATDI